MGAHDEYYLRYHGEPFYTVYLLDTITGACLYRWTNILTVVAMLREPLQQRFVIVTNDDHVQVWTISRLLRVIEQQRLQPSLKDTPTTARLLHDSEDRPKPLRSWRFPTTNLDTYDIIDAEWINGSHVAVATGSMVKIYDISGISDDEAGSEEPPCVYIYRRGGITNLNVLSFGDTWRTASTEHIITSLYGVIPLELLTLIIVYYLGPNYINEI
jgi:hypothetical protein